MRLYGAIEKVEPLDDGTVRVHGIASTEAMDDQGEIVAAAAMREAIPEYMRFPALREMHQLAAAGTTIEAAVGDDGSTRIVAHVVDPVAVSKVKNQVYRGFSIGGRVIKRKGSEIVGLKLNEISLVDRPANPEAIFDMWKVSDEADKDSIGGLVPLGDALTAALAKTQQIWACDDPAHRHTKKDDAAKCMVALAAHEEQAEGDPPPLPQSEEIVAASTIEAAKAAVEAALAALAKAEENPEPVSDKDDLPHEPAEKAGEAGDSDAEKVGARVSAATRGHLNAAHDSLVKAGAKCAGEKESAAKESAVTQEEYTKALDTANAEKAQLLTTVGSLTSMVEKLSTKVDEIARVPLPALTARALPPGITDVSKRDDGRAAGHQETAEQPGMSPSEIAAILKGMSPEERVLLAIKASHMRPQHIR